MPTYNGACEAGIGAVKSWTEYMAARQGRNLDWSAKELYAAQPWANQEICPGGYAAGTPASRFAARTPIDPNGRDVFQAAVLQCENQFNQTACDAVDELTDTLKAIHHRRAARQVLVECGYLDFTRSCGDATKRGIATDGAPMHTAP